ncbi:MAG: glycosyltransferase family 4 protein [Hyphomonadaceae bacterium]|nr:glycosyltransferase family 4 protein [Hyphomonadaceae bacterium]
MRVVFLAPRYHTNLMGWCKGLAAAGADITLLVVGKGRTENHTYGRVLTLPLLKHQPLVKPSGDFALFANRCLPDIQAYYRILTSLRPDVVVARGLTPIYIMIALPFILLRSRLVLYTQGPIARPRPSRLRPFINSGLLFICSGRWFSPVWRRDDGTAEVWTDSRISHVPFAIPETITAKDRTWNASSPRLLAIGKFEPRKNHEVAIRCLAELPPCVTLTIAGELATETHSREYTRLQRLARELGVTDRVTFRTNTAHDSMSHEFLTHDLFLSPASDEPASISQLEAMAHGLPIIIKRDNGTASYVQDGVNGYVGDGSIAHLTEKISLLLGKPALFEQFGRASVELASRRHAPATTAAALLEIFSR